MAEYPQTRRADVLHAIVRQYIATQEPVGSKSLVERHQFHVSPATIRNDMAALEAEGYIVQQHASSGRIPTEKAYRVFVDSLHEVKPLSAPERRAIMSFLEGGLDLEDVLRRSVVLLSQLTRQAAVVQLPTLQVSRVKHCEVVLLSPMRLLLVLITDAGRVEQRNVELAQACTPEQVAVLRDVLNGALDGVTMVEASAALGELAGALDLPADIVDPLSRCVSVLLDTVVEQPNDRLILAGAANLTRIPVVLPSVLEALEEQVVMLKLLANVPDPGRVNVLIDSESGDHHLRGASVVTTGYGAQGSTLGGLGVVGPTHMDYLATMSKVHAVAQYVGVIIDS